ncbi:hypothetical protein Gasu2_37240 [Galdieria sulphuraria]|uniref:Mannan polymerase II complex MNN1 subunit n=1 Tax=Galdieria sulphuraria TaxID=130081 RepID=M2XBR0_GALSU|nr:mannan polymerase II complex MNN1 subunit [Galdieria sulphuraria]EME27322.1 mannan polymerase II complex MNN1 subunit [Galdieria sulphuraria]GJD09474.1 hypothetical protein Gasu2_37240 [Galdieria sulphuraria]|eukprot:XP_005703842.1 mannan polymerase II complex MNN1 subunit [Galdieria sulphuraria]
MGFGRRFCWIGILFAACIATFIQADSETKQINAQNIQSSREIGILQMFDGIWFFQKMGNVTLRNKQRYASRHGYDMIIHSPYETTGLWEETSCKDKSSTEIVKRGNHCYKPQKDFTLDRRAATFGKIKLALAACVGRPNYWLLWSDADALIVNQSIPLEDIIDNDYDIILTEDWLMINAGVFLLKCSPWNIQFLNKVYHDREFDKARALDQSALQTYIDKLGDKATQHVKYIAKHVMNVYLEEYRPGDFLLHMAGKLYEATPEGATAIAQQFDVLSQVTDVDDIDAFFSTCYVLNYGGLCHLPAEQGLMCPPEYQRKLPEPMNALTENDRYRHVTIRYPWMGEHWKDKWADHVPTRWSETEKSKEDSSNHDEL